MQTTFDVETPSEHERRVDAADGGLHRLREAAARSKRSRRRCRGRGSPRRSRFARAAGRPRRSRARRPASTRGRGRAAGGRRRPPGSGGVPRRRSSRSGSRTPGRVVRGRDDAAPVRVAADDERLRPQRRILELLDSREERVEVEMGEDRHADKATVRAVTAPLPPPRAPAIVRPAPFQASYGLVSGRRGPGTRPASSSGSTAASLASGRCAGRRFTLDVALPAARGRVRVETVEPPRPPGRPHRRSTCSACPVAARPRLGRRELDGRSAATSGGSRPASPGRSRIYVENLATGAGRGLECAGDLPRSLDAEARDRGHRTARADGPPAPGSDLDRLLRPMLIPSDNAAANALLVSARRLDERRRRHRQRDDALDRARAHGDVRRLRARHGARRRPRAGGPRRPLNVVDQPAWGAGKATTAARPRAALSRGLALERRASARSMRPRAGLTPAEARYLCSTCSRGSGIRRQARRAIHGGEVRRARHAQGRLDRRGAPRRRADRLARRHRRRRGDDDRPCRRTERVPTCSRVASRRLRPGVASVADAGSRREGAAVVPTPSLRARRAPSECAAGPIRPIPGRRFRDRGPQRAFDLRSAKAL